MESLIEARRRIFDWANGDAVLLSARCAKAEEERASLGPLIAERTAAQAECRSWEERGEWENCPARVIQRSLDADRALLRWFDE